MSFPADNYVSPEDAAGVVADHAFFQYERTLQRESLPELSISLPPAQPANASLQDAAEQSRANNSTLQNGKAQAL